MVDPVTLISLIAAIAQLIQMGGQGINALSDLAPEFDQFWEEFEKALRDEPGVSGEDLDACYRDPEFPGHVIGFIAGLSGSRDALESYFANVVPADKLPVVMQAAEEAATDAASDDRRAVLASRRFLEEDIERAKRELSEQLGEVSQQVADVAEDVRAIRERVDRETATSVEPTAEIQERLEELIRTGSLTEEQIREISRKLEAIPELLASQAATAELDQERLEEILQKNNQDVIEEVTRAVVSGFRAALVEVLPTTAPSVSSPLGGLSTDPIEKHLEKLRNEDGPSARRIETTLSSGGVLGLVQALRRAELDEGPVALLVTAARIVVKEGFFAEAEQAYLQAASLATDDEEKARQFVRAARMADLQRQNDRYESHLDSARGLASELPLLAIEEARVSHDSEFMLTRLEGVEGTNDEERALIHQTRAQAHLSLGDEQAALAEFSLAREAAPDNLSVREFAAILPWFSAQLQISRGEHPAPEPLIEAAERFSEVADEVEQEGRASEAAAVRARAAEALMWAERPSEAIAVLEGIRQPSLLSGSAQLALARAAMVCDRADLVLEFIPETASEPEARLARAEAQSFSDDPEARRAAVPVLEELLASEDEDLRQQAAFALIATAASDPAISWHDGAAAIVKEARPETEAAMRAERLYTEGKITEAEAVLLPYAGRLQALRRLRDYAAAVGDWNKVEDRARAVLRIRETPRDRMALAEALRQLGRTQESLTEFMQIARAENAPEELREAAFGTAIELEGGARHYERIKTIAQEWRTRLPGSRNALWNLSFAHARLSEHDQAYELLRDAPLEGMTERQATLFAEVLHRAAPPEEALRRLIDLSDRFGRRVEALEALVIATSLRAEREGVELDKELGERITDTYATFEERFPDSKTIITLPAPTTAEEFLDLVRELQGDRPKLQQEAIEGITDGRTPVNVLAAVSSGGVGATWARLHALPLSFATEADEEAESSAAEAAIGGAVVWDSSSLFVTDALGTELRDRVQSALPGSIVATETLEDADNDAVAGGRGTAETMHDVEGKVVVREISDEERQEEKRRIEETLAFVKTLGVEPPEGDGASEELLTLYREGKDGAPELNALVGSLLLAQRSGRPLFSDDRWIRAAARSLGIPTFGTLALLNALARRGVISEDDRRRARAELARRGGWGVCLDREELIDAGRASGFQLNDVLVGALFDRAAWRGRPANTWQEINGFLAVVFEEDRDALRIWIRRSLAAAQQALPQLPKSRSVQIMLMMAWGVGEGAPQLSEECFQTLVDELKRLPPAYTTLGHDVVLGAIHEFLLLIADEPNAERYHFFRVLFRRLRLFDQVRALRAFVRLDP